MSYLDQLNASPKFEVNRPEKPKHPYFLKMASSFLPIFVLALGLGAALILMRDRQKITTKASLETTNLFMIQEVISQTGDHDISIFASTSSGKLVAIELPINYPSDLLTYQGFATSSGFPNLLPANYVIVAAAPDTPMVPPGLVGTLKFRTTGVGGLAHITFGAVKIAGLNSLGQPLSENLAGTLTGVDIELAGPTATPTPTPTAQPINWTQTIGRITAEQIRIIYNSVEHQVPQNVTLTAPEFNVDRSTFKAFWNDSGDAMDLTFYFANDGTNWWTGNISTKNYYYSCLDSNNYRTPLRQTFTAPSNLICDASNAQAGTARIIFKNLTLSPSFIIAATTTPSPTPTPTTPAATATLGASPTPTERPYNNCGGTCGSNMNCKGELYCYFPDIKNHPFDGVCRNPFCDQSTDCNCKPTATPSPRPTATSAIQPTAKPTVKPTIVPTVTLIPTPFVVRIVSPTPTLSPLSTLSPSSASIAPTVPQTEPGWWDKFVEWIRSLLGK